MNPARQLRCTSRPTVPTCKTRNRPSHYEALKRRRSLTIWVDPAMTWDAAPTGKRGRQPADSDAGIQTCLPMKVLFGMAPIRDQVTASRRKGMWMGGVPPFGDRVEHRKPVLDDEAADRVRGIFAHGLEIGSLPIMPVSRTG